MRRGDYLAPLFISPLFYVCYFVTAFLSVFLLRKASLNALTLKTLIPIPLGLFGLVVGCYLGGRCFVGLNSMGLGLLKVTSVLSALAFTFCSFFALLFNLNLTPSVSLILSFILFLSITLPVFSSLLTGFSRVGLFYLSLLLLLLSICFATLAFLFVGGFPLLTGERPPAYTWPMALSFALGVFSYSLLASRLKPRYFPLLATLALIYPLYGYLSDLFVFILILLVVAYYRRLMGGFTLFSILAALLAVAVVARYAKALVGYEVWTYDVLRTALCRLADSLLVYAKVADRCLLTGAPWFSPGWIWLSGSCPNLLIARVFLGINRGIAPTFLGNPLADGGLAEVFALLTFTGFSLAFTHKARHSEVGLACYSVCLSEFLVRFERGFSAYELVLLSIALYLCLNIPLIYGEKLANSRYGLA